MNPPEPERRSRRLKDSSSSRIPQQQPNSTAFPTSTTYSRDEEPRAEERKRNRSQGAASLRGTTNVPRREIIAREGLRSTEATQRLVKLKERAVARYRETRGSLRTRLTSKDFDDDKEPAWLIELLDARNSPSNA